MIGSHDSAMAMMAAGGVAIWIAGRCRASAAMSLSWQHIRVPQDLHDWQAGKNLAKLKEEYKAEFPEGKKMNVASFLDLLGAACLLAGFFVSWIAR